MNPKQIQSVCISWLVFICSMSFFAETHCGIPLVPLKAVPVNHPGLIDTINRAKTTWKAAPSPVFSNRSLADVKFMCGVITKKPYGFKPLPIKNITVLPKTSIPENFDSRTQWKECAKVIGHIRDQASCGSCWAFASTEAFNDRLCIASGGKFQTLLSVQDTTSCCSLLRGCIISRGCNGGEPSEAWRYFENHGLVTGGDYPDKNKGTTCYPYEFPMCAHHVNDPKYPNCTGYNPTPKCQSSCTESSYKGSWSTDGHFAKEAYGVDSQVEKIQTEIMTNGPVTAAFYVYSDFPLYSKGVYQHVAGSENLGGHAVKIIGWGVEKGVDYTTPYWLVANSWNQGWGDQGYFQILRGSDECGIESLGIATGLPKINQ